MQKITKSFTLTPSSSSSSQSTLVLHKSSGAFHGEVNDASVRITGQVFGECVIDAFWKQFNVAGGVVLKLHNPYGTNVDVDCRINAYDTSMGKIFYHMVKVQKNNLCTDEDMFSFSSNSLFKTTTPCGPALNVLNPDYWLFDGDSGFPFSKLEDFKDGSCENSVHLETGDNYFFVRLTGLDVNAFTTLKSIEPWLEQHSYPQSVIDSGITGKYTGVTGAQQIISRRIKAVNAMDHTFLAPKLCDKRYKVTCVTADNTGNLVTTTIGAGVVGDLKLGIPKGFVNEKTVANVMVLKAESGYFTKENARILGQYEALKMFVYFFGDSGLWSRKGKSVWSDKKSHSKFISNFGLNVAVTNSSSVSLNKKNISPEVLQEWETTLTDLAKCGRYVKLRQGVGSKELPTWLNCIHVPRVSTNGTSKEIASSSKVKAYMRFLDTNHESNGTNFQIERTPFSIQFPYTTKAAIKGTTRSKRGVGYEVSNCHYCKIFDVVVNQVTWFRPLKKRILSEANKNTTARKKQKLVLKIKRTTALPEEENRTDAFNAFNVNLFGEAVTNVRRDRSDSFTRIDDASNEDVEDEEEFDEFEEMATRMHNVVGNKDPWEYANSTKLWENFELGNFKGNERWLTDPNSEPMSIEIQKSDDEVHDEYVKTAEDVQKDLFPEIPEEEKYHVNRCATEIMDIYGRIPKEDGNSFSDLEDDPYFFVDCGSTEENEVDPSKFPDYFGNEPTFGVTDLKPEHQSDLHPCLLSTPTKEERRKIIDIHNISTYYFK